MLDVRIKEIMKDLANPNSLEIHAAMRQVSDEVREECKQIPVPKEVFLLLTNNDEDKQYIEVTETGVFYPTKDDPFGETEHSFEDAYYEYVSRKCYRDLKARGYLKTKEQYKADNV